MLRPGRHKRVQIVFATAVSAVLFLLAGCVPQLSDADLSGRWVADASPAHAAVLHFDPNGAVSLTDVPLQLLVPGAEGSLADIDWNNVVSGSGEWEVSDDGRVLLTIYPEPSEFIYTYVYPSRDQGEVVLDFPIGDSDFAFLRFRHADDST